MTKEKANLITLAPTDIALWLRLGRCDRLLALKRAEREDESGTLFTKAGVLPQPTSPLLSISGLSFEQRVEFAARSSNYTVIDCRDTNTPEGDNPRRRDSGRLVETALSLQPGKVAVMFQVRLETHLWGWRALGDLDILRLEMAADGKLLFCIGDTKASGAPKMEHFIQLAFYRAMLAAILAQKRISSPSIDIGVIYRGDVTEESDASHHDAAQRYFGLDDAYLEIADAPERYVQMARDLVAGSDAPVRQAISQPPETAMYRFELGCVGCRYDAWCCKDADSHIDLSLLPYMTLREKKALIAAGVRDISTLANLKLPKEGSVPSGTGDVLVDTLPDSDLVIRKLLFGPAGPRLSVLILRARASLRRRERSLSADSDHVHWPGHFTSDTETKASTQND